MADSKKPKPPQPRRRPRKSSPDNPRVIVVDASPGNVLNAVTVMTDTLIEVFSVMATGVAQVRATIDDRDSTVVFDEIEIEARRAADVAAKAFSGMPVAMAVLAAGALLHSVIEAYKKAYAEAAQIVTSDSVAEELRATKCGHTAEEHAEMATAFAAVTRDAAVPMRATGRMRGRDAGH